MSQDLSVAIIAIVTYSLMPRFGYLKFVSHLDIFVTSSQIKIFSTHSGLSTSLTSTTIDYSASTKSSSLIHTYPIKNLCLISPS